MAEQINLSTGKSEQEAANMVLVNKEVEKLRRIVKDLQLQIEEKEKKVVSLKEQIYNFELWASKIGLKLESEVENQLKLLDEGIHLKSVNNKMKDDLLIVHNKLRSCRRERDDLITKLEKFIKIYDILEDFKSDNEEIVEELKCVTSQLRDSEELWATLDDDHQGLRNQNIKLLEFLEEKGLDVPADVLSTAPSDINPFLIDSSVTTKEVAHQNLCGEKIEPLVGPLKTEEQKVNQADIMGEIADGIEKMGGMTQERLTSIVELMTKSFEESFKNQETRAARRKADDKEEDTSETDKDDQILTELVRKSHAIFKVYGRREAMDMFKEIFKYVVRLFESQRPFKDLLYGLRLLDDVFEFTGADSFQHCQRFLPTFRLALGHQMPEVRKATSHGVGLMAMFGGPQYSDFLREAGQAMAQTLTSSEDARSVDNNLASENFISALTKICKYQPSCVPGNDLDLFLSVWITWLPVYEDDEETVHVYGFVCDLIETHNPVVMAPDNMVRIIKSIATCVSKEVLPKDHDVYGRCLRLVKSNVRSIYPES